MIALPATLSRYLGRQFLVSVGVMMAVLCGIVYVLDVVELMRRAAKADNMPFGLLLGMAAMKSPQVMQQILPFGVLFGAIHACWKLNRTQELAVIRAAGVSAWQFLAPMVMTALALGIAVTTLLNPVSSVFAARFNQMEITHLNKNDNLVTVSRTGIWLRQPTEAGYALFHAAAFNQEDWRFRDVTVFFFAGDDTFTERIDSPLAYLRDGQWDLKNARVNKADGASDAPSRLLPTALTIRKIEESFSDPETISFWKMPEYINIMEETGLPTAALQIHFQSLLSGPLLLAAMVLLAATFSLRPPRFGGAAGMIALGVAAGFFIFFMESMLFAFGTSQKIPVLLAAWTPALVTLLAGASALLHMEDG